MQNRQLTSFFHFKRNIFVLKRCFADHKYPMKITAFSESFSRSYLRSSEIERKKYQFLGEKLNYHLQVDIKFNLNYMSVKGVNLANVYLCS